MLIATKSNSLFLLLAFVAYSATLNGEEFDDIVEESDATQPPVVRHAVGSLASPRTLDELAEQLSWRIIDLDDVCGLDADQKRKLRLAGQGDIKRLLECEKLRTKAESENGAVAGHRLLELLAENESQKRLLNGDLFEDGSLFSKTRRRILTSDQLAKFETDTALSSPMWTDDFREAQDRAQKLNRPILIHFSVKWAAPVRKMEKVIRSPKVVRTVRRNFISVSVDAEQKLGQRMMREFGVKNFPTDLVITPDAAELCRCVGILSEEKYLLKLHESHRRTRRANDAPQ